MRRSPQRDHDALAAIILGFLDLDRALSGCHDHWPPGKHRIWPGAPYKAAARYSPARQIRTRRPSNQMDAPG